MRRRRPSCSRRSRSSCRTWSCDAWASRARSIGETDRFSANVYAYLTADPNVQPLGRRDARVAAPRRTRCSPALTIVALAAIAIVVAWRQRARSAPRRSSHGDRCSAWMARGRLRGVLVAMLFGWTLRLPFLKITSPDRVLLARRASWRRWLLAFAPARARRRARGSRRRSAILALLTLFAVVMSFGPQIYARRQADRGVESLRALLSLRPGIRRPARAGALRDDRRARPGGARRLRRRDDRARSANGRRLRRSRLDPDPGGVRGRAAADQRQRHELQAERARAASRRRRDRRAMRRRCTGSSRRCRRPRRSSSCRSARSRSRSATCSIRRCTGVRSRTATAAARRIEYGLLAESLKDVLRRPETGVASAARVRRHARRRARGGLRRRTGRRGQRLAAHARRDRRRRVRRRPRVRCAR